MAHSCDPIAVRVWLLVATLFFSLIISNIVQGRKAFVHDDAVWVPPWSDGAWGAPYMLATWCCADAKPPHVRRGAGRAYRRVQLLDNDICDVDTAPACPQYAVLCAVGQLPGLQQQRRVLFSAANTAHRL